MADNIVEKIEVDLEGLIPSFMGNTHREIKELEEALDSGDLITAGRIGHNIKGSAMNYGFKILSGIGRSIEICSSLNKPEQVRQDLDRLKDYLERVEVEFI